MKAPVFVKIDRYEEIEETLRQIKSKIQEANDILAKLNQIRTDEEHEMHIWQEDIKQMQDKISMIEHSMAR